MLRTESQKKTYASGLMRSSGSCPPEGLQINSRARIVRRQTSRSAMGQVERPSWHVATMGQQSRGSMSASAAVLRLRALTHAQALSVPSHLSPITHPPHSKFLKETLIMSKFMNLHFLPFSCIERLSLFSSTKATTPKISGYLLSSSDWQKFLLRSTYLDRF